MEKNIRIAIVDDHTLFRDGLASLIKQYDPSFDVIWEAQDGLEFLGKLKESVPDVVLMDISMPQMDGIGATKAALEQYPEMGIIALSMYGEKEYYLKMIQAGAKGFIMKDSDINDVAEIIRKVAAGENCFPNDVLYSLIAHRTATREEILTNREMEVLELICRGMTTADIASKLFLSKRTVEKHRSNILSKANCNNAAQLVSWAIRNKFIAQKE